MAPLISNDEADSIDARQQVTCIIPMYRTALVTTEVVAAILRCDLPKGYVLDVIVVDDASADGSAEAIEAIAAPNLRVVKNLSNQGRSKTRNIGGRLAEQGYLLFLDSDCIPNDRSFLRTHLDAIEAGNDISVGAITGTGEGFWHRYQCDAIERRSLLAARSGVALAATSQNFMIRQESFAQLSGFDEAYEGYGFEDRDFFLRAQALDLRAAWTSSAVAIHADKIELASVCRKMCQAGGVPAARFASAHPEVYATMTYAALDARRHPWLRWLRPLTSAIARRLVAFAEPRMESTLWPFALRAAVVRIAVAASYLEGTTLGDPNRTSSSRSA